MADGFEGIAPRDLTFPFPDNKYAFKTAAVWRKLSGRENMRAESPRA